MTSNQAMQKLFAAAQTAASLTMPVPTLTKPSGDGVFSASSADSAELMFWGTNAQNLTALALIIGWTAVARNNDSPSAIWVPRKLMSLQLTTGNVNGVAAATILNTDFIVDTITTAATLSGASAVVSPADDTPAYVTVDMLGCSLIQVVLAKGAGSPVTGVNGGARLF